MWRIGFVSFFLLGLFARASAPKNARDVVADVARAIGAANLNTIQYSGTGYIYFFGQSYEPGGPWPKFNLNSYTYFGNYEEGAAQEDMVRTQFENPERGGGFQPVLGPQRWIFTLTGDSLWHVGSGAEFRPGAGVPSVSGTIEEHQARLAMTPHGWVKAAMASNPMMSSKTIDGKKWTVISFTWGGKYKVDGYIGEQNLLEKVETWIPASYDVSGDIHMEASYSDYRDFGNIKFPTKVIEKQNDFPVLELNVSDAMLNVPADIQVPQGSQKTPPTADGPDPQELRETRKLADGVWFLRSRDENSIAVEFKDYVAVIEAPVGEQFSLAVIVKIKELAPNKPIRYLINSHAHFDHWAGMRAYVAEGATIITANENVDYYNKAFHWPRTLSTPDTLAWHPKPLKIQGVTDKYVLTDGARSVEICTLPCDRHAMGSVMVYTHLLNAEFLTAGDSSPTCLAETLNRQKIEAHGIVVAPIHGGNVAPFTRPQ